MRIFDHEKLNRALAKIVGPVIARALGIDSSQTVEPILQRNHLEAARHRVLGLLAHLQLASIAAAEGLTHVLILEADVRPVVSRALTRKQLIELAANLNTHKWSVLRPTGYFYDFHYNRYPPRGERRPCPSECACSPVGACSRLCEVKAPPLLHDEIHFDAPDYKRRCNVKNLEAYAIHSRTFPVWLAMRTRTLAALYNTRFIPAVLAVQHTRRPSTWNVTAVMQQGFGDANVWPWNDIWLPARFDTLFVLPQLVLQQVKQGDDYMSTRFRDHCQLNRTHEPRSTMHEGVLPRSRGQAQSVNVH
jgi:hypothetical protein